MKSFIKSSIFLFALSLTISACNKDDDNPGGGVDGACVIAYTYDGTDYSTNVIACIYNDNTLNIGSIGVDDAQIQIFPITTTGTYQSTVNDPSTIVFINLEDGTSLYGADATVVVSSINNSKASGTFSGEFREISDISMTGPVFNITKGSFNANY